MVKGCLWLQAAHGMQDSRLLLEVPDLAWAGIVQALTNDPQATLNLELVCMRLRQRQQPMLSRVCARLHVAHTSADQMLEQELAEVDRLWQGLESVVQGDRSACFQKLMVEAQKHEDRCSTAIQALIRHGNTLMEN